MLIKLAFRNMMRNKRRTFIAGIAIGIGLASLIFTDGLMIGMKDTMLRNATSSFMGEAQIHEKSFRLTNEPEYVINNLPDVVASLKQDTRVEDFTVRTLSSGMLTSSYGLNSVLVTGIDPDTEKSLSQFDDALSEGTFFEDNNPGDIVLGSKLAELLEVELGDRVVLTMAAAHTGELSQELFRISGIYHFNVKELDNGIALIPIETARRMLNLPGQAHEIAMTLRDKSVLKNQESEFFAHYSKDGNEALSWISLLPGLYTAFSYIDMSIGLMGLILFGVVALGIINTLFMSIYERMFEFGVLKAVGTRPLKVGLLIIGESAVLALLSIILGVILGVLCVQIFSVTGIDYTGIDMAGVTIKELIYPVFRLKQFVTYPFWVLIFTMIAGIYPAVYASKIIPARALRKSL